MSGFMRSYIRVVDGFNRRLGRFTMYGIFVLVGILLWSSITKTFFTVPSRWTLEMAQFAMVAYYILGGPYSIQMGSNVRMDLFYGEWSARRKAWFDAVTVFCLIGFLLVLLYGGLASLAYSLGYWDDKPLQFFWGLLTGSEEIGLAALHVADQADHDHRHLPDAAAGGVGVVQGHLASSRRGDLTAHVLRTHRHPDVLLDDADADDRAAGVRRHRLRGRGRGTARCGATGGYDIPSRRR
jgi:hypothetical protein